MEICDPKKKSSEELQEARLAVRLAGTLLEGAFGEWSQAEGAGEVIWVEAATQSRHTAASHREATRGTQRTTLSMEMVFTQRATLVLKKAASGEGRETFLPEAGINKMSQNPDQVTRVDN